MATTCRILCDTIIPRIPLFQALDSVFKCALLPFLPGAFLELHYPEPLDDNTPMSSGIYDPPRCDEFVPIPLRGWQALITKKFLDARHFIFDTKLRHYVSLLV